MHPRSPSASGHSPPGPVCASEAEGGSFLQLPQLLASASVKFDVADPRPENIRGRGPRDP